MHGSAKQRAQHLGSILNLLEVTMVRMRMMMKEEETEGGR